MRDVYNSGLIDQSDSNPPQIYRVMTPSYNGLPTEYGTIKDKSTGAIIPGIVPYAPGKWSPNVRTLGVRADEVMPPNPPIGIKIVPAGINQPGAGMSVAPVLNLYPNALIPKRNGGLGSNKDCWFALKRKVIRDSSNLQLHFDENNPPDLVVSHGVIEPGIAMPPDDFIAALSATAPQWVCFNR